MYEELKSLEGGREMFRIAKIRGKATTIFNQITQIKHEQGFVLICLIGIKGRWKL